MIKFIDTMCDTCGLMEIRDEEEIKELDDGYGVVGEECCPSYMGCNGNMIIYTGRKNA